MRELVKANDPVLMSFVTALLKGEGIESFIFDQNISIMEGSIGVFPKRLLVREGDYERAVQVMTDAELGEQITDRDGKDQ